MARKSSRKSAPDNTRVGVRRPRAEKPAARKGKRRFAIAAMLFGFLAIGLGAGWLWFSQDLPSLDNLNAERRPAIRLLAADGSLLETYGDVYGRTVHVKYLPPHVPQAVLAAEDHRFYGHFGIDLWGLGRAMVVNAKAGRIVQGGSTITQQVAKNLFLTPERSLGRKIREAILAIKLEQRFTKDQILTVYMNRMYLGSGTWGIDAAAKRYFEKPAEALTPYEAAMIAGLLKAPSRYNPASSGELAHERAKLVLGKMAAYGFLSEQQAADAAAKRSDAVRGKTRPAQRYFTDWIVERVRGYVGTGQGDLIVQTTLDPELQQMAEARTAKIMEAAGKKGVSQVGLVMMTPEGAVRAMIGGKDYGESKFNRATQALRQPGSSFKPFVYLAALENGLSPNTIMTDAPLRLGNYEPKNYGGKYYGDVTLMDALTRSLNTVAVQVSEQVGRDQVIGAARRLGITAELTDTPSIALGASEVPLIEMTTAYAALANGGFGVWAFGIEEIREKDSGRVLYKRPADPPGRVVQEEHVAGMNAMLQSVVEAGTGRRAAIGRPAAGKTGTSQEFRDAWFIGYTPNLVTGVWMGNDDGESMKKVTGGNLPAMLWGSVMKEAHKGVEVAGLPTYIAPPVVAHTPPPPANDNNPPPATAKPRSIIKMGP